MIPARYFHAFAISTLVFLLLYFILLSLTQVQKVQKPKSSKVIKVSIISPPKKVVTPIVKTFPLPVPVIPKPIVKEVIEKKPKKIIKKQVAKKRVIKKKIVKKKIVKKVIKKKVVKKTIVKKEQPKVVKKKITPEPIKKYKPVKAPVYTAPKPIIKQVPKPSLAPKSVVKNNYHKKAFLRNVRSKIIANKKYPKIAKRRHIEGSVKVRFDITKHGQVTNIRFINGKRVFQKSIKKTLERTFPMGIPNEVKSELPILNVSVILHFNIR